MMLDADEKVETRADGVKISEKPEKVRDKKEKNGEARHESVDPFSFLIETVWACLRYFH